MKPQTKLNAAIALGVRVAGVNQKHGTSTDSGVDRGEIGNAGKDASL